MNERDDERTVSEETGVNGLHDRMATNVLLETLPIDGDTATENGETASPQHKSNSEVDGAACSQSLGVRESRTNKVCLNVGILGHVDCGKTTLARVISSIASTAAFDKHAKAQNLRANTIDLGFSSLNVDGYTVALIDCPGHASLIGAVLSASSVFDMAVVVVDAQKGVQPQTAEHLLLVSILCPQHVIIVLNKIDLVNSEQLESIRKRMRKVLKYFGIPSQSPIVSVSLVGSRASESAKALIETLRCNLYEPKRISSGRFVMSVDHCFPIRGKGTVMTGTVVDGCCSVGMEVVIPSLKEKRKVKGMQRWKEDIKCACMGERVGVLFQDIPTKDIDRTVIFQPAALDTVQVALASITQISHFKCELSDRSKIHVSIGFETVMATCQFLVEDDKEEFEQLSNLDERVTAVLLTLDRPIYAREGSFYMAAKLDMQGKGCRFAFYGNVLRMLSSGNEVCRFRRKHRSGCVVRIEGDRTSVICTSLFSKESDVDAFLSMVVKLSTGERGTIEGPFGKSGKIRVRVSQGLSDETVAAITAGEKVTVELWMKKYLNNGKLMSYLP
uniref:Tr-type G domain-containing protein n=1 Tax=Ascaris lumbricoides TaxID=6252 RepID=A0A0M3HNH7_ASCLU